MFRPSTPNMGLLVSTILAIFLLLAGCSAGGSTPLAPEYDPEIVDVPDDGSSDSTRQLWGLFQIEFDIEKETVDIQPLRSADAHLNAIGFLETDTAQLLSLASPPVFNKPTQTIDVNVALMHPYVGLDWYTGFDVRGVLITHGKISGFTDPDLVLPGEGSFRLLNADGYTRWWNPAEFEFKGYIDGKLGTQHKYMGFDATINGYKLFADDLTTNQPISDLPLESRASFGSGMQNIRHYTIRYDVVGLDQPVVIFNYAIDASYEPPKMELNDPDILEVPEDFPPGANGSEAWRIDISEISNTLYHNASQGGGSITYHLEVFDWQGSDGIERVWCEYPGAIPYTEGELLLDNTTSAVYKIEITDASPTLNGTIDVLFAAQSVDGAGYQDVLPGKPLTAYNTFPTIIATELPNVPPVAAAEIDDMPDIIYPGTSIDFDANASYDPDGIVVSYEWDFDGDGLFDEPVDDAYIGDPVSPSHIFNLAGEYHVNLKVTDNDNATDTLDEPLIVIIEDPPGNDPPVAIAEALTDTEIYVTAWCEFDATASYDPDDGDSITLYEWDFDGDGIFDELDDDAYEGDSTNPRHKFIDIGVFDVNLKVFDTNGASDMLDTPIAVTVMGFSDQLPPDEDATQIALADPAPYQGERPVDLSVLEEDGVVYTYIIVQDTVNDIDGVYVYYDNYSQSDLIYGLGAPANQNLDWDDINRICVNNPGSVFSMISANPQSYWSDTSPPAYMYWNLFNSNDGHLQGSYLMSVPQRFSIDISDGMRSDWVTGNPMYLVQMFDTSGPGIDPGTFVAARFQGNLETTGFSIDAIQMPGFTGTGPGMIDFTSPLEMRLGIDDTIYGLLNNLRFYILDDQNEILIVDFTTTFDPYHLAGTIEDFGTGTPVDLECMNSTDEYGIDQNWVAVLLENNGEYQVRIFRFSAEEGETTLVAQSPWMQGDPHSMDIDDTNFAVHVLADNGGTIEATRFTYIP